VGGGDGGGLRGEGGWGGWTSGVMRVRVGHGDRAKSPGIGHLESQANGSARWLKRVWIRKGAGVVRVMVLAPA